MIGICWFGEVESFWNRVFAGLGLLLRIPGAIGRASLKDVGDEIALSRMSIYLSLSIIIYHYLSLSIIIYHYLSLSIYLSFHPSIYPSIYLVKNTIVLISTISIVYMATMHSTICAMDQGLEPQTICRRKTIQRSCTRHGQLDKRTNVRQR